jgi:hypothetical protein
MKEHQRLSMNPRTRAAADAHLPGSLLRVLEPFRPCFTAPTFNTFVTLLAGMIAQPAKKTVCGMLSGAGLAGMWHHSRAHRFFATARWHPDTVGVTVLRLIVGHLVPLGAPLLVAVDDTLFRRSGHKVFAAHWVYDGSLKVAKGNQKLSRGNTFVVAAVVVTLPFLDRPVALPVLARLWRKSGPAKTVLARQLIEVIAAAARGGMVHVVADGAYLCTELRRLPPQVTLTGPLRSNASLWHVPPRPGPPADPRATPPTGGAAPEWTYPKRRPGRPHQDQVLFFATNTDYLSIPGCYRQPIFIAVATARAVRAKSLLAYVTRGTSGDDEPQATALGRRQISTREPSELTGEFDGAGAITSPSIVVALLSSTGSWLKTIQARDVGEGTCEEQETEDDGDYVWEQYVGHPVRSVQHLVDLFGGPPPWRISPPVRQLPRIRPIHVDPRGRNLAQWHLECSVLGVNAGQLEVVEVVGGEFYVPHSRVVAELVPLGSRVNEPEPQRGHAGEGEQRIMALLEPQPERRQRQGHRPAFDRHQALIESGDNVDDGVVLLLEILAKPLRLVVLRGRFRVSHVARVPHHRFPVDRYEPAGGPRPPTRRRSSRPARPRRVDHRPSGGVPDCRCLAGSAGNRHDRALHH